MNVSPSNPGLGPAARDAAETWFGSVPLEGGPPLAAGFSGAGVSLVRPRGGTAWHVLKAFGPGTPRSRAEWVHALVRHVATRGVAEMPPPVATRCGETVVTDAAGVHWELVPFVVGDAVESPSTPQAAAALAALARVHVAAATLPGAPPRVGPAPAVLRRVGQAAALGARPWRQRRVEAGVAAAPAGQAAGRWDRAIEVFEAVHGERAVAAITAARVDDVHLQPVLRDVWHAHVLFAPGSPATVAGIVDPHAADIDTPATDLARLLGSWRSGGLAAPPDPCAAWAGALEAYVAVRPLAGRERSLVPFLHAAGVVLGLDNWFRWLVEERRPFANPAAALTRIDRLIDSLPAALAWLADHRVGV